MYNDKCQNYEKHGGIRLKKISKIFVKSALICFSVTFALILINSIMGVHVGLDYYFMAACVFTMFLTIGTVLCNSRRIFAKHKKVVRRSRPVASPQRSTARVARRKIS
jgi:hypothetical protein